MTNLYDQTYNRCLLLLEDNQTELLLHETEALLKKISKTPYASLQFMPCADIDGLLSEAARNWRDKRACASEVAQEPVDVLIVTSFVHDVGGHTREIEDWVASLHADKSVAILTSRHISASSATTLSAFSKSIPVYTHEYINCLDILAWLVDTIKRLNPKTLIVSPETRDAVLFAALAIADFDGDLIFNLNLDHNVSPGLFIERIDKIIVKRPYIYSVLKNEYKFDNLVYVPLARTASVKDYSAIPAQEAPIVTSSCTSVIRKIESDYLYQYCDVISEMIVRTGCKHVHIGAISDQGKASILNKLKANSVPLDHFIHVKYAERLSEVFTQYNVNVLIQTFPIGGGLVSIEAMEAGLVVLNHRSYNTKLYNFSDFCYSGAPLWQKPEELYAFIQKLDKPRLEWHREKAIAHYKKYNKPGLLEHILASQDYQGAEIDEELCQDLFNYPLEVHRSLVNQSFGLTKPSVLNKASKELKRFKKRVTKLFD